VAGDEVGEVLRLLGIEYGAQQEVDERLVGGERERLGGLALARVHRALVTEELRVEADARQVAGPVPGAGLPHQLQRGQLAVPLDEPVLESGGGDAAAVDGERQVVEA